MENTVALDRWLLVCFPGHDSDVLEKLKREFYGPVVDDVKEVSLEHYLGIFVCGDLTRYSEIPSWVNGISCFVIQELSTAAPGWRLCRLSQVPRRLPGNLGLYVEEAFPRGPDYFAEFMHSHTVQGLTESQKGTLALRKGIYLSRVSRRDSKLHFHLLRCSSNLQGPTDHFQPVDEVIVGCVNDWANCAFTERVDLNHVLAQVYYHTGQQGKARIRAHSDKTKDMPRPGLMAFCTFYDREPGPDYKGISPLTLLDFRLKPSAQLNHPELPVEFTIPLKHHSLLIIPLSTNRLYTHEIRPSPLPVEMLPLRLGYVVRCSKTRAVFHEGQTFLLNEKGQPLPLHPPSETEVKEMRQLYLQENMSDEMVEYPHPVLYSLNQGDYQAPTGGDKSLGLTV